MFERKYVNEFKTNIGKLGNVERNLEILYSDAHTPP